ncbi:3'-5' exonuclease [Legionella israelensis]|uniref:3'-5' exonuclease n=1 Tax=Legionella israelensis TaxID=454 RepID=UPI00118155D4|nr:3'-5' exonuclease [Legionella israelensis]QDP72647.1 3'-5' exonuclease [Legionella israelensis]
MSVLVFDIETVPDIDTGKRIYGLDGLDAIDCSEAMFALRREKTGTDFLPHYLQKIVAISLVLSHGSNVKVWSLGTENSEEKELISRFFSGIDKHTPILVSWNGSGFDLPVLHYRALLHGVTATTYWETGDNQQNFRWNNYLSRFHYRHLDLMDVLAAYQLKAFAPLDEVTTMLGFPGKMGMSGHKVWEQYLAGNLKGVRDYCETDVLNTYCIYLRFELMRGNLSPAEYEISINSLIHYLNQETDKTHLQEFAKNMKKIESDLHT